MVYDPTRFHYPQLFFCSHDALTAHVEHLRLLSLCNPQGWSLWVPRLNKQKEFREAMWGAIARTWKMWSVHGCGRWDSKMKSFLTFILSVYAQKARTELIRHEELKSLRGSRMAAHLTQWHAHLRDPTKVIALGSSCTYAWHMKPFLRIWDQNFGQNSLPASTTWPTSF